MVILHPLKAWRWSLMLSPMQRISPWTLYQYNLAGCAATNVLPARSGQAVRVVLVCRHGLPVTGAIAVVVLEEILNASMLALIALPLPFMLDLGRRTAVVLALVGVGRTRRLPRGGGRPRAGARVGRPLPHDAFHPRAHRGCGGSGTGIARCPGHARRGGSAMTLPLPVVPAPMGTAEGPVRPAASSARLTVAEWLRFGPFLAQIVVTRRCNLSCGYCNEYDDHSAPVPFETLDRRLLKLHQLRTWVVCLTGGEPTLHPDLVRIVPRMSGLGFRLRQLFTY